MRSVFILALIHFFLLSAIPLLAADQEKLSKKEEPLVYKDEGRRDPFWPLVSESGTIINYDDQELDATDIVLQGIMTGAEGNVAVINSKIVKEGDMVGAFRIEKVMPTVVVLDNGQEKIELELRKENGND